MSFIEDFHSDQVEFYATLGHAITQWASVERALFLLYCHTIGEPESAAPIAAYYSIISFNAKLTMVDNALIARYRSYPDVLKLWSPIKNYAGKRAKDRNELAGLPESLVAAASDSAKERGKTGSWVFTLSMTSAIPFLKYFH